MATKKKRGFIDKVRKGTDPIGEVCEKCSQEIKYMRVIDPQYLENKNAWRFKEKVVGVCNCNRNEIFGQ